MINTHNSCKKQLFWIWFLCNKLISAYPVTLAHRLNHISSCRGFVNFRAKKLSRDPILSWKTVRKRTYAFLQWYRGETVVSRIYFIYENHRYDRWEERNVLSISSIIKTCAKKAIKLTSYGKRVEVFKKGLPVQYLLL